MSYRSFCKKLLLICFLFNTATPILSMNYAEMAKAGFSILAKGVYWGILSLPAYGAFQGYKEYLANLQIPSKASKEQEDFVRATLKEHNFSASFYQNIKVQTNDNWAAFPGILYIKEDFDPKDPDQADLAKGFIIHEVAHIQNYDPYRHWALSLLPFIIHYGLQIPFQKTINQPSIPQSLLLIPSAMAKMSLAMIAMFLYSRHRESKADDEIIKRVKDPKILQAASAYFSTSYKTLHCVNDLPKTITWKDRLTDALYDPIHPCTFDRVQKFEDARKVLEAKQVVNHLKSQNF